MLCLLFLRLIVFISSAIRRYICRPLIYNALCTKNSRWYFKQVHFYSVFLSICCLAQDQCVSFHKVLQWFIFLQGLRISKHTVFPVHRQVKRYQFTQVASSLLRSMWHWRRSLQCWVFALHEGRLFFFFFFLTSEFFGEFVSFYSCCQQPGLPRNIAWLRRPT